jgi:hypothetical protein
VNVKDVPADEEGATTIEVTKGKTKTQTKWQVVEGSAPINGEPAAMEKDARKSWKTACAEWKKEFREDNKENRILSMSCGSLECSGSVGQKVCSSTAQYKISTKASE